MKLLVVILIACFNINIFCQEETDSINSFVQEAYSHPSPKDSVPMGLFITESFFSEYGLVKGQVEKNFIVWNSIGNDHIERLVDIRWVFETNEDAIKYHNNNLIDNLEEGQEIEFEFEIEKQKIYMFTKRVSKWQT